MDKYDYAMDIINSRTSSDYKMYNLSDDEFYNLRNMIDCILDCVKAYGFYDCIIPSEWRLDAVKALVDTLREFGFNVIWDLTKVLYRENGKSKNGYPIKILETLNKFAAL